MLYDGVARQIFSVAQSRMDGAIDEDTDLPAEGIDLTFLD
jgi:hypothetical protein